MNFTESALTILYLLQEAKVPLNMEQICTALHYSSEFTYIDASISISSMLDKNCILKEETPIGDVFSITVDGRISLAHLKTDIRGSVRKKISEFINDNVNKLSIESTVLTRITMLDDGKYQLHLRAFDRDTAMNDIILTVNNEEEAKVIAKNWELHADDAIAALYNVLIKDI